jgi:hypothetical protein
MVLLISRVDPGQSLCPTIISIDKQKDCSLIFSKFDFRKGEDRCWSFRSTQCITAPFFSSLTVSQEFIVQCLTPVSADHTTWWLILLQRAGERIFYRRYKPTDSLVNTPGEIEPSQSAIEWIWRFAFVHCIT